MLFIAPWTVDMSKAIKDYHPSASGRLTRDPKGDGSYSASGIYGDATLATRQKGEIVVRAIVDGIFKEIKELRSSNSFPASQERK
jgi:creatinine amidohydrolase